MKLLNVVKTVSAVALGLSLVACGDDAKKDSQNSQGSSLTEIKLGVVGEHTDEWKFVAKKLEEKGIKLTLVKFADYTLPNRALNDGDIDLNAFQHKAYLREDCKSNGYNLVDVADTIISPLGAYSDKIKNLDELKEGDTVAIPNDPTNGGRALKLLEKAGVISLDASKGYLPTVRDITENSKNIKIYEVDAGNTPSLIPDVAVSIINANYATDNGLNPNKDAIYLDSTGKIDADNPYVNVVASRVSDKDRAEFKTIFEVYHTKEVADIILEAYKGSQIPAFKY
ncbi:MAG: MetQ/NlpA family ABC transporter substrate-binding protein [Succinivibrio sp.]